MGPLLVTSLLPLHKLKELMDEWVTQDLSRDSSRAAAAVAVTALLWAKKPPPPRTLRQDYA